MDVRIKNVEIPPSGNSPVLLLLQWRVVVVEHHHSSHSHERHHSMRIQVVCIRKGVFGFLDSVRKGREKAVMADNGCIGERENVCVCVCCKNRL